MQKAEICYLKLHLNKNGLFSHILQMKRKILVSGVSTKLHFFLLFLLSSTLNVFL